MPVCLACGCDKARSAFANAQLKKPGRRCRDCVDAGTTSPTVATVPEEAQTSSKSIIQVDMEVKPVRGGPNWDDWRKVESVLRWFYSLPNLVEKIACIAWKSRHESPVIRVEGPEELRGSVSAVAWPRSMWGAPDRDHFGFDIRFAMPDFDPDRHFFALITAGHYGTKDWPCATPRFRFPLPPAEMDDWVEQHRREHRAAVEEAVARARALEQQHHSST